MKQNLDLDWIDSTTAHVANHSGKAVFDVSVKLTGSGTVDGKSDWLYEADKLPDGEFIGVRDIATSEGGNQDPPTLEITWRSEDSAEDDSRRVPLIHPDA